MSNKENQNECPVKPPKLISADSLVETCASCGAWVERYPAFLGDNDSFWQCDKCDNTSVKIRDGRKYGKKSREWSNIVQMFEKYYLDIYPEDWDTIVTEPAMKDLDWDAIRAWNESRGIYNIYISVGSIQE